MAAPGDALLEDLRDDLAVARQQRLGRAHLGAERQLARREAVRTVLLVFGGGAIRLRAAGAEGALVHLPPVTHLPALAIFPRPDRTRLAPVSSADAELLRLH